MVGLVISEGIIKLRSKFIFDSRLDRHWVRSYVGQSGLGEQVFTLQPIRTPESEIMDRVHKIFESF